jgi:hypothetical protein
MQIKIIILQNITRYLLIKISIISISSGLNHIILTNGTIIDNKYF